MLKLGYASWDDIKEEIDSYSPTKYTFRMISTGFKQRIPWIKNSKDIEVFKQRFMDKFSKDSELSKIYTYELQKRYGDDVKFVSIDDAQFKRNQVLFFFLFETTVPMTCAELDERFGQDGIFFAYSPLEVTGIYDKDIVSSKRIYPKTYVQSARYTQYQGKQIKVGEGETTAQAISRYKSQIEQEEADRLASEKAEKEAKALARAERRKTPKYANGTIVLTKDGEYFQVYDGYYSEYDHDIEYDAVPCTETGKWRTPKNYYDDLTLPLYQKDIQRKIK